MIRKTIGLILLSLSLFTTVLSAQETAEIVYAEGEGFTLVRQGETEFHDLYVQPAEGMVLQTGDVILTEQNTWMEIEINHTGSLIKIAENTTFSINSLENRGGVFGVSYGRVRARVEKLTEDSPFWIQGNDTVAGVRGTDFGYDLFYERESPEKTKTDVYCFKGKVEVVKLPGPVTPEGDEGTGGRQNASSVMLGKNEMVSVDSDSDKELEKEKISRELRQFWEENDFEFQPVIQKDPPVLQGFHNDPRQLKQAALYTGVTGTLIGGIGIISHVTGSSTGGTSIGLGSVGGLLIGSAGYFFIRALILDRAPSSPGNPENTASPE